MIIGRGTDSPPVTSQNIRWDGYNWVDCNTGVPVIFVPVGLLQDVGNRLHRSGQSEVSSPTLSPFP
jgi:hypothetical protein